MNKDSDSDGILDWEESLWGTDPTKKETTEGIPDQVAIDKIKAEQGMEEGNSSLNDATLQNAVNLTRTDQFSRELFATIAAASQNGAMDQATIDALSITLAEKIQNPNVRKIFLTSDIKISKNDDADAVKIYGNALNNIQKIYTLDYTALDVLQKFSADENNVDVSVLSKLDPIIAQTNKVINTALKTSVPKSLADLHLKVINSLERLVENLIDIKLYNTDAIVSFGAIFQYNQNASILESDIVNLQNAITQKLSN